MALPSSGTLGFDSIAAQLRYPQPYGINCNYGNPQWAGLAQRPVGQLISIDNFYSKWAGSKMGVWDIGGGQWGVSVGNAGTLEGDYAGAEMQGVSWGGGFGDIILMLTQPNQSVPTSTTLRVTDDNFNLIASIALNAWTGDAAGYLSTSAVVANPFGTTNGAIRWFTW